MKDKTVLRKITLSATFTYAALKLPQQKIDPYTRTLIGFITGLGMAISENNTFRSAGVGLMIGGALQALDASNGGRLSFNHGSKIIYVLDEYEGIKVIAPGEIPKSNIDGFTFKGLNGVFKLSDGVYAGVDSKNKIKYSFGVGKFVNQFRNAGFKTELWIALQIDKRWNELYQKSF